MACVPIATTRAPRSWMLVHASVETLTVKRSPTCGAEDATLRAAREDGTRKEPVREDARAARAALSPPRNRARERSLRRMPNDMSSLGPHAIALALVTSGEGYRDVA